MIKKIAAVIMSLSMLLFITGCSKVDDESSDSKSVKEELSSLIDAESTTFEVSDTNNKEGAVKHISPMEKITANTGSHLSVGESIVYDKEHNTIQFPLSSFINKGDYITSFTFVVRSEGGNIGEFKGGFGISVSDDCPAKTNEGWYQSPETTVPIQGSYGEITWNVPSNVAEYVNSDGTLLFGYWWGNVRNIVIDDIICSYSTTKNVPVDGTITQNVGEKLKYNTDKSCCYISDDFMPESYVPQVVTFKISSTGNLRKFSGSYSFNSATNGIGPDDVSLFVNGASAELTWFVPEATGSFSRGTGEFLLNYWWSEQPEICLDSITVKYSDADSTSVPETIFGNNTEQTVVESMGFRSALEIVEKIKVGWNLGNSLDSYNTGFSGLDTEIGWGNIKTTSDIIKSVKSAGFNAIRIPVTWGEHLVEGTTIDSEWMKRVQEVVDYAYNEGLFVILNMHHDDYLWFHPTRVGYNSGSAKLKAIWKQIAERFADYDDRLIFEGMDEPRTVGGSMEWIGGSEEERKIVNEYIMDFVNAVRETGGKNAERTLIVTSYAASCESVALDGVSVPNNGNIIFSVHFYAPWKFSDGTDTVFDFSGQIELDNKFDELKEKFIDLGIPVIIDEFGCVSVASDETRASYYEYYIKSADKRGIKCFVWDNGIIKGSDGYGILTRESLDWNTAILNGIMKGAG